MFKEDFGEFIETHREETPFFLFSKKRLAQNYESFRKHFPHADIHFAMKANSEPEVLQLFSNCGAGFEVASIYELDLLKKIGVHGNHMFYGTSVKPAAHIKAFAEYGVDRFACDCSTELEKIATNAPGSKVFIRIYTNDKGSVFRFSEKFGTDRDNAIYLLRRAKDLGLVPYGVSFHVGSQSSNPEAWAEALQDVDYIMQDLLKDDIKLHIINLGGGFPCATYLSAEFDFTLSDIAQATYAAYEKLPYQPKLVLEPGRALVANAGIAVGSIIGRVERKENTWLFLDAGVYNVAFESMPYQGSTRYRVTAERQGTAGESLFAIAGPTGDSPDVISKEVMLPSDMEVGERIIIHDVGAYNTVTAIPFNGFPKPAIYYI